MNVTVLPVVIRALGTVDSNTWDLCPEKCSIKRKPCLTSAVTYLLIIYSRVQTTAPGCPSKCVLVPVMEPQTSVIEPRHQSDPRPPSGQARNLLNILCAFIKIQTSPEKTMTEDLCEREKHILKTSSQITKLSVFTPGCSWSLFNCCLATMLELFACFPLCCGDRVHWPGSRINL